MRFFGKYIALIVGLLGAFSASAGETTPGRTWPLDLSTRYLTSNFMEFRGGRFHAGLDLKTQSREGFVVRAVEDGYISRVRCTPTAYGRVVYLRGVSGKTFVFAHLARFNDDLQARVLQVQNQNDSYRARLEFKAGQVPIKKGQVLGISGQSGTGGPHLHFEVRDRSQRPINPLDHGFAVNDTIPPVIHNLRAWPVTASSKINGSEGEWVLKTESGQGLKGELGVLNITGPVAFSARMVDASDIRGHKLEPWLIELTLDGELVYRCQNERYAFDENALQRLEWTDWADWTEEGVPREHWLHRRQANTLTGREGDLWYLGSDGEGLAPGDHALVLRAVDHAGAEATVRWVVRVEAEPASNKTTPWQQENLGITIDSPNACRLTPFFSNGAPEKAGITVINLEPNHQDAVLEKMELWVRTEKPSTLQLGFAQEQGLKTMGPVVSYLTADWPIESSVPVSLPQWSPVHHFDEDNPVGVYRLNGNNEWKLVSLLGESSLDEFYLNEPGLHGVFMDMMPPVFENNSQPLMVDLGPVSQVDGVTFPKWEVTPVRLIDLASGVDTGSITAKLDATKLIVEPDPPRDRLLITWPEHLAIGHHLLHLSVSDKVGNTAAVTYEVHVQEESP